MRRLLLIAALLIPSAVLAGTKTVFNPQTGVSDYVAPPNTSGWPSNASGCLSNDGSGNMSYAACSGGGGGTPAAPANSVQYNNGGSFGGSANFTTDGSSITSKALVLSAANTNEASSTDVLGFNSLFLPLLGSDGRICVDTGTVNYGAFGFNTAALTYTPATQTFQITDKGVGGGTTALTPLGMSSTLGTASASYSISSSGAGPSFAMTGVSGEAASVGVSGLGAQAGMLVVTHAKSIIWEPWFGTGGDNVITMHRSSTTLVGAGGLIISHGVTASTAAIAGDTSGAKLGVGGDGNFVNNLFMNQNNGGLWLTAYNSFDTGILRNAAGDLFLRTNFVDNFAEGVGGAITIRSSATVTGAGGLGVTYGAIVGSMTVSNLTSGQCVQAGTGGLLTVTGSACGSGGSGITALTGDVTASGTGSVTATAAANQPNIKTLAASSTTISGNLEVDGWTVDKGSMTHAKQVGFQGGRYDTSPNTVNANYTAVSTDTVVLASSTLSVNGGITITLPSASTNLGQTLEIYKVDTTTNPVLVVGNGSDVIAGTGTWTLNATHQAIEIKAMGTINGLGDWECVGFGCQQTPVSANDSRFPASATTGAVYTANHARCMFFTTLSPVAMQSANYNVNTQSGNCDFGVYAIAGGTAYRVASKGSFTCPAPTKNTTNFTSVYQAPPGQYMACIAVDNASQRFTGVSAQNFFGALDFATAFPLPATLTMSSGATTASFDNLHIGVIGGPSL